jgi:hypothetical protein
MTTTVQITNSADGTYGAIEYEESEGADGRKRVNPIRGTFGHKSPTNARKMLEKLRS